MNIRKEKEIKKAVTMKIAPSVINLLSLAAPYQKSNLSDFVSNAIKESVQKSNYTKDLKVFFESNQTCFQKLIHESVLEAILDYLKDCDNRFVFLDFRDITLKMLEAAESIEELQDFSKNHLRNEALVKFEDQVHDVLQSNEIFKLEDQDGNLLNGETILLLTGLTEMFENEVQIQVRLFSMEYSIDVMSANLLEFWVSWLLLKEKEQEGRQEKKVIKFVDKSYQPLANLAHLLDNIYENLNETIWYNTFNYLCEAEFKKVLPTSKSAEIFFDKIFNDERYEIFQSVDRSQMKEKIIAFMSSEKAEDNTNNS